MSTKSLWLIAGSAVAAAAVLVLIALAMVPQDSIAEPAPTPTASAAELPSSSATPSPTPTATATATPAPTFTPPATLAATCENTSTDAFRSRMATAGWVSWEPQGSVFESFPNGRPAGAVSCRWGVDPDLGTDNVIDLAWAPIDPESAIAAMQMLDGGDYVRTDAAECIYYSRTGPGLYVDAEGWGDSYCFTVSDVRWAQTRADVRDHVKAPGEAG